MKIGRRMASGTHDAAEINRGIMRALTTVALLALCACSSTNGGNQQGTGDLTGSQSQAAENLATTVLRNSTVTFKAAQAACTGALGSMTFSLNHIRAHPATGVDLQEKATANGMSTMIFSAKTSGETATVGANSHDLSVSGKNVTVKLNKSVACVQAE
jgi:hypothetical protein